MLAANQDYYHLLSCRLNLSITLLGVISFLSLSLLDLSWSPYYQDHLWYLVVYASAIGTWWSWKELAMVSTADASAWGQPLTSRARAKCTTAPSRVWCTVPSSVGFSICWRHPFRVWSWHTLLYISSDYSLATAINCPLSRAAPHQLEIMPEEMENIICQLLLQPRKSLVSTITQTEIILEDISSSSLFLAPAHT